MAGAAAPSTGQLFMSEFMGTAVLLLLGGGVVATNLLPKSKGKGGGWLMINMGWGLAVFAGVYVAYLSGATSTPRSRSRRPSATCSTPRSNSRPASP